MTLFIASLLIYHYGMAWWWYAIAVAIWGGEQLFYLLMAD
jgi:hypothetical protein